MIDGTPQTLQHRGAGKVQGTSEYLGHSSTSITMNFYMHEQRDDDELFDPEHGQ